MNKRVKKIFGFAVFLVLMMATVLVFAAAPSVDRDERVYDFGGYLTEDELKTLQKTAAQYSEELEVDFVAVITDDNCGLTPEDYVADFYQRNIFGYHDTNEGVIMYINMKDRDIWVGCKGVMEDFFLDGRTDQLYQQAGETLNSDSKTPHSDAIEGFLQSSREMTLAYREEAAAIEAARNPYADSPVPLMGYFNHILDQTDEIQEEDRSYLDHIAWWINRTLYYDFRMLITDDDLGLSPGEYMEALVGKNEFDRVPGITIYYNISTDEMFLNLIDDSGLPNADEIYNRIRAAMDSGEYHTGDNAAYNASYTALRVVNAYLAQINGLDEQEPPTYEEYLQHLKSLEPTLLDAVESYLSYVSHPVSMPAAAITTLIAGLILLFFQRRGLRGKPSAISYAGEGVNIYHRVDRFVSTHTTKTAKPKESSSSSSSRSTSSSGAPRGSGGKF